MKDPKQKILMESIGLIRVKIKINLHVQCIYIPTCISNDVEGNNDN